MKEFTVLTVAFDPKFARDVLLIIASIVTVVLLTWMISSDVVVVVVVMVIHLVRYFASSTMAATLVAGTIASASVLVVTCSTTSLIESICCHDPIDLVNHRRLTLCDISELPRAFWIHIHRQFSMVLTNECGYDKNRIDTKVCNAGYGSWTIR